MTTLTATNSRFTMTFPDVFAVPQRIQGYSVDDAFGTDPLDVTENVMGVDGKMSSGYTPNITKVNVMLQADSPSVLTFETLLQQYLTQQEVFIGTGVISLPGLGKLVTMSNVVIKSATQFPTAKKIMQPQAYVLEVGRIVVSYQNVV